MRVLVTGAGGLLGGRLAALLAGRGLTVIAARRRAPAPLGLAELAVDLVEPGVLERTLLDARPEAVVHAAVMGRAGDCEARPAEAEAVNARLPGLLARRCRAHGIRLIALSTDLVFAGDRAEAGEGDPPGPLSVYGRTKLAGENAVLSADPSAAVARVALIVGRGHGRRATASESVAWALAAGRTLRLYADEYRTPVDPQSVASAIALLLAKGGAGRFHLGGPERLSRYELGLRTARLCGLTSDRLQEGRQADHSGPDRRPADVSLDSARAHRELGWEPLPLDEALRGGRLGPD